MLRNSENIDLKEIKMTRSVVIEQRKTAPF